jgi:hypothetical protein
MLGGANAAKSGGAGAVRGSREFSMTKKGWLQLPRMPASTARDRERCA